MSSLAPQAPPAPGGPRGLVMARALIPPALRAWIARLDPELAALCCYQLGFDAAGGPRDGGKLLRPALCLLSAAAAGGDPSDAVSACVAVELIHNATLVHDDIMDGDKLRRHRPTAWARFGVPAAILAGDALLALAFETLTEDPHPAAPVTAAELTRTLRVLSSGQERDLRYERLPSITLRQCLSMLEAKSGSLLGFACRAGASYAGAPPEWRGRFSGFGTDLGVAFQLVDDLLGIWGDPRVTGKPAGSDLRARKKSAPVVAALSSGGAAAARLAELYGKRRPLNQRELRVAAKSVEQAGGRDWTLGEIRRRTESALERLEGLDLDHAAHADLRQLAAAAADRAW
ncbi:MAG TPA: polyprenyl synthetase family protein [Actinocrinis sp.]|uniref:polyprenyl synthetase family protein n=1 Tax=Actinocrinis sp. TaxID=1920516 RepID=UPI002DDD8BE7|nr:polyprenyl synthetase family protein [Actinocrinis sp.]HEV3169059.1 polyprenyl synthetase family protein [Actinocrinis sp.]